ncbi:MAG: hypothetical protein JW768_11640 [Chitinispirillaceae bacterium]|nr:hypothetical protein [Chitinispirillaceae bacterium]
MYKFRCLRTTAPLIVTTVMIAASAAAAQNTLTLNVGQARDTIKRTIYGGLMEDWGRDIYGGIYVGTASSIPNTNGMRNDIIQGLKEIRIGVLQFPGGCNAEVYKWREGIGPKSSRPGGDRVNGMGTDEYFQLCSLVNCAPFIQANCRSDTPAEMAAWLNYINTNFPNRLRYLGLGNEPWGGCYPGISVTEYLNNWYDPFKAAIPAAFSGKIIRIAAAGYSDQGRVDMDWTNAVLAREAANGMEGLSWHYYTTMSWTEGQKGSSYQFNETEYYTILGRAYAMETQATTVMRALDSRDPNYKVGLQPDEWGAWYDQIPGMGLSYQQSTVRDAQITAQHLNFFNNNCRRIWMAQQAQPVNAIHALFLTHPESGALIKTPTYYVFKLYVPHQNARMVPLTLSSSKVNNLNALNASASIDSTGTLHISIANIHATSSQNLTVTINGGGFDSISGEIVNGPAINSYNDYNTAERVNIKPFASSNYSLDGNRVTVTLPAHSVVMLTLRPPSTGTIGHLVQAHKQFDVSPLPRSRIMIRHGCTQPTRVTVELVALDGTLAAPKFCATVGPGAKSLVWYPEIRGIGSSTYIVTMRAGDMMQSKRLVLRSGR